MHNQKYGMPRFSTARRVAMRGAATVEFAFLLIPLLLLGFGGAEYGRALYQYNTLVKSVRDSARYLSQYNPADANYPLAAAKNLAVYGDTSNTGTPLAPGLNTAMVNITNATSTANPLLTVTITGYKFNFVINPANYFTSGVNIINFNDIHATMRQL